MCTNMSCPGLPHLCIVLQCGRQLVRTLNVLAQLLVTLSRKEEVLATCDADDSNNRGGNDDY